MKDILIIQNISREGPGLLQNLLDTNGLMYDIVDLDKGDTLPAFDHKALVVLGGPDSANDNTPKMTQELAYVQQVLEQGTPFIGICLGLQVAVKALGGNVTKSPMKEIGLLDPQQQQFTIELTPDGQADPLLQGLPAQVSVFHLHGETVELTPTMQLLGTGKYCQDQIVRLAPKAYGIQSHFELTPQMLTIWAAEDPDLTPIGANVLLGQFQAIQDEYTRTGQTIFTNFLKVAGLLP